MAVPEGVAERIAQEPTWNARVAHVRRIPEDFGTGQLPAIYSAVAELVYVPHLVPDFAYVHWRHEYEAEPFAAAYSSAHDLTDAFEHVDVGRLAEVLLNHPRTLRIFRNLLGLTTQELAAATTIVSQETGMPALTNSRVKGIEGGREIPADAAQTAAEVVHRVMTREMFATPGAEVRDKVDKPDTVDGWNSVRRFARDGVPLWMLLHQRHYGGAFRQLLDATSATRGDILEEAVASVLGEQHVSFIRTGSHNQSDVEKRFGLSVRPAPDFVVFDGSETLRAVIECKGANDGGTARDKASRFRALRQESMRLGGIPLFAVLSGLGWRRTMDALGPVVRDTDGRTFTLANLDEMLTVQPFPDLAS